MSFRKSFKWILWLPLWTSIALAQERVASEKKAIPQEAARRLLPDAPVTLELRDADIKAVLRALGKQFNLNLLVHEEIKGLLTLSFTEVPLRDAVDAIAGMASLAVIPGPGGIIEILPGKLYNERLKEQVVAAEVEKAVVQPPPPPPPTLITQKIDIQHAYNPRKPISGVGRELGLGDEGKDLNELAAILKKQLSGRPGSDIAVVNRLNSLIVTDTAEKVEEIVNFLKTIDVPSITVGIEAKIAEISDQALEELGVQWGGINRIGIATLQGGGQGGTTGTAPTAPQTGNVGLSGSNFIVNLPAAAVLAGRGFSLGFILGTQATRILDIQLSALEQKGKAKLLASPRVTTPNHERAWIESGREVPYLTQQVSGGIVTFTVAFKKVAIELEVTPHVIGNEFPRTIALDTIVTRREVDFANAVQGNPALTSRTLFTRAIVKEGETAVIGGLSTEDTSKTVAQVPYLSDVPIFGWLFKNERVRDDKLQLMVFISPTTLPTPFASGAPPSANP